MDALSELSSRETEEDLPSYPSELLVSQLAKVKFNVSLSLNALVVRNNTGLLIFGKRN